VALILAEENMKDYLEDLLKFRAKLEEREAFALSRYGDGELRILKGNPIDYGEWKYDPTDATDSIFRERMLDSLRYRHPGYYVGISCPHCIGKDDFESVKRDSGQDESHLTWSTLFVNSNYPKFIADILPLFHHYEVVLVCKRHATFRNLPFTVTRDFRVGDNAWKGDYYLIGEIKQFIEREKVRGKLFLLCAGPFSCILAHQLHSFCPENFYIDIGSTIDPYLFGRAEGLTRGYLRGTPETQERCVWA